MKLSDIKIYDYYTDPSLAKMDRHKKRFLRGKKDAIVINSEGYLIDGYITYLIYKDMGVDEIPDDEIYLEPATRCYIYGKHPGNNKEYVWINKTNDGIVPGDQAIVNTRFGPKTITVTDVVISDYYPRGLKSRLRTVIGRKDDKVEQI